MSQLNRHYRVALQPLLDRARSYQPVRQQLWLDELRADCPIVARDLEALLRELKTDRA